VGPKPDGTLPQEVINRLAEIGKWMNKNGEAIYNTRTTKNYREGNIFFTQSKDGKLRYAIACFKENEALPAFIEWRNNPALKGSRIKFLETGEEVKWIVDGNTTRVFLPSSLIKKKSGYPALAFSLFAAGNQ